MQRANSEIFSLAERPDLRARTIELIEKNFPTGSPVSRPVKIEEEFALLLAPSNSARNLVLITENRAAASASYQIFDVRVPGAARPLRCAGIGLVVTDNFFRFQGLATRLQREIETRAREEGCEIAVLWSDLVNFYSKLNYVIAGREFQWHLDKPEMALLARRLESETPSASRFDVRPLRDMGETRALFEKLSSGPQRRDLAPYDALLELPNTWALGAFKENALVAYALLGKARDLRDTIHEMVGEPKAVASLFKAALPHVETRLRVHQPTNGPLNDEIEHWLGPHEVAPLAFFKVLDAARFASWLEESSWLPQGVRVSVSGQSAESALIMLSSDGDGVFFETDDPAHLIQLFLGPYLIEEMSDLPPVVVERLRGHKIPALYFWGFDSV